MSHNQSRAERSETTQYRKTGRSGSSNQQRQFSGGVSTKGGGGASSGPTNPSNRSFKKYNSNAPVGQPSVGNWNVDSSDSSAVRAVQNGAHQQPTHRKEQLGDAVSDKEVDEDLENEKDNQQILETTTGGDYKMPLVWIDLEMTGLNVEVDRILEIACVITDGNLTKSVEGPDLVIHQTKECLDKMGEWCQEHHSESGLTKKVLESTISEQEAEKQVLEFVKRHVGTYKALIAGNSVYMDLLFIRKYMPDLAALFSHVIVDVSSIKALCLRWYPRDKKKAPQKANNHRAMDDIKESIAELKFYKEHIFKTKSRK